MATQIQIKRGSTTPAGLTVGESAMNTSTNQIYLGGTGGTVLVGGEVTGGVDMGAGSAVSANRIPTQSGVYNYVRNSTVTSFNGLTGAVGGVCAAQANTFTALQTFNSGISAAGGVTLAGTFSGTTGSFSKLLTASAGISASALTVSGGVTFTSDIRVNTMTIGRGNGQSPGYDSSYNTAVGFEVLKVVSPDEDFAQGIYNTGLGYRPLRSLYQGSYNTALGAYSLYSTYNGAYNTAVGSYSLSQNTSGSNNTAIGAYSISANVSGIQNVGIGFQVLQGITQSNYNTAVGYLAGLYRGSGFSSLTSATGGIFIGHQARGSTNGQTNEIVIGRDAVGLGSNTTVLGATSAVSATIYGLVNAPSGISAAGGTFSALTQFTSGLSGHINISETNLTGNMYLLMARGAGVTAVFADTTTTPLVYQASAGNLGLKGITLVNGNDYLYITPTQITATNTVNPTASYFYFIAQGGNYFQSQTLSQIGDIGAVNSALSLNIDPSTRTMTWSDGYYYTGVTSGFFGVNRNPSGMCADYAVEINSPTGKGLQLIYNDYTGAASNWVNMDVSSGGNYTLRPSGGLATVTGTLNVSAGISAAGGVTLAGTFSGTTAAFTGLVSSTVGFSGSGTNLKNIVTTFNGLSGAVTGASLGANTFTELNTFNAGISASALTVAGGATFSGNVSAQSTLYTDTILAIGNQINIANAAGGRIAFGDYDGAGNSTYVFIRDGTSSLLISNPYGLVGIGDPNNVDSGNALLYDAVAGSLDGGNSALTNFSSGSFGALLTASAGISAAGGVTFAGTVASDTGYRITSNAIKAQTGTTYTFLESDNGKVLTFNNGSAVTVTIPTALPVGFNCTAIQLGAGQVGFTAASGLTLQSYGSQYRLIGQHAAASIIEYSANIVNLSGNLVV